MHPIIASVASPNLSIEVPTTNYFLAGLPTTLRGREWGTTISGWGSHTFAGCSVAGVNTPPTVIQSPWCLGTTSYRWKPGTEDSNDPSVFGNPRGNRIWRMPSTHIPGQVWFFFSSGRLVNASVAVVSSGSHWWPLLTPPHSRLLALARRPGDDAPKPTLFGRQLHCRGPPRRRNW